MNRKEAFLSTFSPLPKDVSLPERVTLAYEPVSCLSRRETRQVWQLRCRADDAPFVLKAVPAGEEDLAEEFRILNRLAPVLPGVVPQPVDCFQENGTCYLLRAYLPGETLAQSRERADGCSPKACALIGRKLCALLEVLHTQEPPVVHRDIKPENIILLPDGGVGLIDFGIARQYKGGQDTDTRHLGTRTTAAPEQYGYSQTDPRTDLYALGMTLIWLLTGQYDRAALENAAGVPRWLARVLERAAAFDPQHRYASAAAFDNALRGPQSTLKKWVPGLALLLCGALALGGNLLAREPENKSADVVTFDSACLETAVRAELERPDGDITYGDLAGIERLAVVGEIPFTREQTFDYRISCYIDNEYQTDNPWGDITDLSLLAHMPNLRELYLCRQEITDLSPLEGLPLTTLALCENQITDLSPLSSLTELETLYLGDNPATDYSLLSSLAGLRLLNLDGSVTAISVIDDLNFLEKLTLRDLSLGRVEPKDRDWFSLTTQVGLDALHLWEPPEAALAAANTLEGLQVLTIGDYTSHDLTPLSGLSALEVLNIYKGLESLDGIDAMPRLLTLAVGGGPVSDLSPLAGLAWLNFLKLEGLPISDFSPLAELPALGCVYVDREQLAEVEAACPQYTFRLEAN